MKYPPMFGPQDRGVTVGDVGGELSIETKAREKKELADKALDAAVMELMMAFGVSLDRKDQAKVALKNFVSICRMEDTDEDY